MTLSVETIFSLLIGFFGLIATMAAGYATLRERIKTTEVHINYIRKTIEIVQHDIRDIMRSMKLEPRQINDVEITNHEK